MSDIRTSRFITFDDPQLNKVIVTIPKVWWSRPYEYAWASSFIEKDHVILDAACGISHPFKYYICDLCDDVYACDLDELILSQEEIGKHLALTFGQKGLETLREYLDKPHLSMQDISKTSYDTNMFDRIICISVLEHLSKKQLLATLLEFKRLLKEDGLIAITLDYPHLKLDIFNQMLEESGLVYADKANFELPDNAVTTNMYSGFVGGLFSFRALLKKSNS